MHRASDRIAEQEWLDRLDDGVDDLGLDEHARTVAADLYLSALPLPERSKRATLAASCYTASLITGDERSQGEVARAFAVSRLSIQQRWKEQLETVGFTAPEW